MEFVSTFETGLGLRAVVVSGQGCRGCHDVESRAGNHPLPPRHCG